MRNLGLFILALVLLSVGRAQQFDNPVTVPVSFYGEAIVSNSSGASFSFGATLGTAAWGNATAPSGTTFYSASTQTANLMPGKQYTVNVFSSGCAVVFCHFIGVDGTIVYIEDIKMNDVTMGTNYTFRLRVESANDITQSLADKRGGQCSSLQEDKPFWYIGLGKQRNGRYAGAVGFRAPTITSALYNPSSLLYDSTNAGEVFVTRDTNGFITRIDAPEVVVKVDDYAANSSSYGIHVYVPTDLVTPFANYTISNYGSGTGVRVDKSEDGKTWSTALQYVSGTWTRYDWQESGAGTSFPAGNVATTVVNTTSTVTYGSGTGAVVKRKTYQYGELTEVVMGPGAQSAPTTSYTYYAVGGGAGSWPGALASETEPSGRWTKYDYFNASGDSRAGQIQRIYRPWLDAPTTYSSASTGNSYVETYDYTTNDDGSLTAPSSRIVTIANTVVGKTTWAYDWYVGATNQHSISQTVETNYSAAASYLTTTTLAYRENDPDPFFRGKIHAVTRPNGTKDAYAYYSGSWDANSGVFSQGAGGSYRLMLAFHGQNAAGLGSGSGANAVSSWTVGSSTWTLDTVYLVPSLSTITETVIDSSGRVVFLGENVSTGAASMERIAAKTYTYNNHNLLTTEKDLIRSHPSSDVIVSYQYEAGLQIGQTDVDGTRTAWHYNTYLLNDSITTAADGSGSYPAKVQSFTYYSSNLKQTSQDCSCSPAVTTYTYETTGTGRILSKSEPGPNSTTLSTIYSYGTPQQTTVTLPNGATQISEVYYDGKTKSVTGTGQVDTRYDYTYDSSNIVKTTKHGSDLSNGWLEERQDWLGRVVVQRSPETTWATNSNKIVRKDFSYPDSTGQLVKTSTTDESGIISGKLVPDHFYFYGNMGLLAREGDDVDASGALSDSSTDRIKSYLNTYYKDVGGYNGWIWQQTAQILRTLNNASDVAVISDVRTRLTRFNNDSPLGANRVLSDVVQIDPSGRVSSTWEWVNPAARTRTRYTSVQGLNQYAQTGWQDGYLASELLLNGGTRTYAYNSVGLLASSTEGSTNAATTQTYWPGTKYLASTVETTGASSTATTLYDYSWDTGAQKSKVQMTDPAGKVAYTEYDAKGLPIHTWGNAAQPTEITYDAYGRRTNLRTWQTGYVTGAAWSSPGGGNLVSWGIDAATGAVLSKSSADNATVWFTYNPRGQIKTRTWARGPVTTYYYFDTAGSATGELQSVSYSDGTTGPAYTYTRAGALATAADATGTRTFAYRSDLALASETLGSGFYGANRVLAPTYDPSVPGRGTGYQFTNNGTVESAPAYGFDPNTGRISTAGDTDVSLSLTYVPGTDAVQTVSNGGGYVRTHTLASRYDVLSRVLTQWSGATKGDFSSVFSDDQRAFRTRLSRSGEVAFGGPDDHRYTYTPAGELQEEWSQQEADAHQYFRDIIYTNDSAGNRTQQWELQYGVTNYTPTATNTYSSITSLRYETGLAYDVDGNMTQDGTWIYSYDGENRLNQLQRKDGTQTLQFAYDYLGRRVKKTVRSGGPAAAVSASTKFVWSGWSLAAELDAGTSETGTALAKTYLWGPDVSGGAGAGGLLAVRQGGTTYLPVYDPMGNVTGYLNNSTGAVAAAYEYFGYGMLSNQSGSSGSFAFGYSTQYTDRESGLVYYGLRFYNPVHGRFVNRDPIAEAGGNNLFAFVGNNPVNRWDVLGLGKEDEAVVADPFPVVGEKTRFPGKVELEDAYHLLHWGETVFVGLTFSATIDAPTIFLGPTGRKAPKKTPKDDCVGLKDPKTGKITPVYDDKGGGVAFPQNADVAANVKTAQENSPWWKDTYDSGQWFASMVGYGKPWDYKTQGMQYESFGNFHYGYVGKAADFSDKRLLTEAGRAQIENDRAHNRPVFPGDPGNRITLWGAVAPYGDEPKDQVMIQQGMDAYKGNKELVHIPCGKKQ